MVIQAVQGLLALAGAYLAFAWSRIYIRGRVRPRTSIMALCLGAVTNFFDALGIGSFAPTTAAIKFFHLTSDENIPGTLNVGHSIPTIIQALVFILLIKVDTTLLLACVGASVVGALWGARIVAGLPIRTIRLGMGGALLVAAAIFTMRNLNMLPGGGDAIALVGASFAVAVALHFAYGALMTLGIGLYAPSLISLSMLGMDPRAAFPIMMGACAFLMPAASLQFIRAGRFDRNLALGLTIGGVPAVLVAAFIVKEMPLELLRWLVSIIVIAAAAMLLRSGLQGETRDAEREA